MKFFIDKGNLVVRNKPVVAQIEPTSQCNLKCEFCVREKIGVPIGTMKFEDFKKILDKLDCLFKIHLSGQGEPFVNREIFEMIAYANKRGILVNTTTNGMLLNKQAIEKLCDVEMGEITFSIDSARKETYEKIRKGANFESVIENIKTLVNEAKRRKKRMIVSIASVILQKNIDELPEFVKLANRVGIKKLMFQTIQTKEDYVKNYDSKIKKQAVNSLECKFRRKMGETKRLAKKHGIQVIFDEEKSPGCVWPWRSIYISWNGSLSACCKILDYRNPVMGNILKQDFWEIWNGKNYQTFRKLLRERKPPAPCRGCSMV